MFSSLFWRFPFVFLCFGTSPKFAATTYRGYISSRILPLDHCIGSKHFCASHAVVELPLLRYSQCYVTFSFSDVGAISPPKVNNTWSLQMTFKRLNYTKGPPCLIPISSWSKGKRILTRHLSETIIRCSGLARATTTTFSVDFQNRSTFVVDQSQLNGYSVHPTSRLITVSICLLLILS